MTRSFPAFRIHQNKDNFHSGIETLTTEDLTAGNVLIEVAYSGINYKDALAGAGRVPILRKTPLNGGIDLAGTVVESDCAAYQAGDGVLVQGGGLGEIYDGGYAHYARLPAENVIPMPAGLDAFSAMAIGTAGFTAALSIERMERNGQTPEMGPIVVTGATGGVGSFAIHLLSRLGYECVAASRKTNMNQYLQQLGATRVIAPVETISQPLGERLWGGAIDNLGGETLATLLKHTTDSGNVVSIGLVQSPSLETSVMPFIIRGVSLLGVTSANCPHSLRRRLWERLGGDMKPECIKAIVNEVIGLEDISDRLQKILSGVVCGRIVVDLSKRGSHG